VTAPCVDGAVSIGATAGSTCQVLPESLAFTPGLKAVVLAFEQDVRIGMEMPRQVWDSLSPLLAADRDGIWKLADARFACASDGARCEYAQGRHMELRQP
jgi:hypothetical protein